jgi:hypothetical protein
MPNVPDWTLQIELTARLGYVGREPASPGHVFPFDIDILCNKRQGFFDP